VKFDVSGLTQKGLQNVEINGPRGFRLEPSYIQAAAIIFLFFLLVLMLGQFRKRLLDWHMKGFVPGIAFGFIIAMLLEGFLIIGGRTALTEILGWKNPPRPVASALDAGRDKLVVLVCSER